MWQRPLGLCLISSLFAPVIAAGGDADNSTPEAARLARPLTFVENLGQTDAKARFIGRGAGLGAWFTDDGFRLRIHDEGRFDASAAQLFLTFEGASSDSRLRGERAQEGVFNYFHGNDPAAWIQGARGFDELLYESIYPGVDVRIYDRGGRLEYDVILAAGASLDQVVIRVEGADDIVQDEEGTLLLHTALGPIHQTLPETYRVAQDGKRTVVKAGFRLLKGSRFGFDVEDQRADEALVVDPGLAYGTYLGGSSDETGNGLAVGGFFAYVTGRTTSIDFPTIAGAVQPSRSGPNDAFVTKVATNGAALFWSTYLGGSSNESGTAIAIDSKGNVHVTGTTNSTDFPFAGNGDATYNGAGDGFLTMLNGTSGGMIHSNYLGGSGSDTPTAVVADAKDGSYVVGVTQSSDFPTTGGLDTKLDGTEDMFLSRSGNTGKLISATYLGGSSFDRAEGVAFDGEVVVIGRSFSSDFPTTSGAYQSNNAGGYDVVIARVNETLSSLQHATYFGSNGNNDFGRSIAINSSGTMFATGNTFSTNFPTTSGSFDTTHNGGSDTWVACFKEDLSTLVWSTFLGGSGDDAPGGLALDSQGGPILSVQTGSSNFPLTADAFQSTYNGAVDAGVVRLDSLGKVLRYSTYYGGNGTELIGGGFGLDSTDSAYIVGTTFSTTLPTNPIAFDQTRSGASDAFVAKLPTKLCNTAPTGTAYGTGKPGSAGTPQLIELGAAELGKTSGIRMTNALPGAVGVTLVIGASQLSLPFDGGTLWVSPDIIFVLPFPVPASGQFDVMGPLPADASLCGVTIYHQMWYIDFGASGFYHTAQTNGLARKLGSL